MNKQSKPAVTVIIPIAPGGECEKSLKSVRLQNYPRELIQILVSVGRHRSIQRNRAIEKARGDVIWFMDNDVEVSDPEFLNKHVRYYEDSSVASVGGPSLTPESDSFFQKCIGGVLGSWFATQSVRARYRAIGKVRETNEKELILCSQTFRASAIGKGFDDRLHSGNEENHLMNEISRKGFKMIYDPDLFIHRSQRKNFKEFILQMGKYGKSRMEHFFINRSSFELLFLIPLFFLFYLISIPLVCMAAGNGIIGESHAGLYLFPLLAYGVFSFLFSLEIAMREKRISFIPISILLFLSLHIFYAVGSLFAVYKKFRPETREIPEVVVKEVSV